MLVVGVDPGKQGGIVILDEAGKILQMEVMPLLHDELEPNYLWTMLSDFMPEGPDVHVFLEKAQAMSRTAAKQGVVSMFNYGIGFGYLEMAIAALDLPCTLVTPQAWQKTMFAGTKTSLPPKVRAAIAASRLAPERSFLASTKSRVPHKGLVDAFLIASYGRRQLGGLSESA